jgi:hypothetical protein
MNPHKTRDAIFGISLTLLFIFSIVFLVMRFGETAMFENISYIVIILSVVYFAVSYFRKGTRSQTVDVVNNMSDSMAQTVKNFYSPKAFVTYVVLFLLVFSLLYLVNNNFLHIV